MKSLDFRTTLFDDYCEKCLVENLIDASELLFDETTISVIKKFINPYLEAILQIDLIFEKTLLSQIEEQSLINIEFLYATLADDVDENISVSLFRKSNTF